MEFVLGGITLPLTPEKVTVAWGGTMKTWNTLDQGEVVFPRGRQAVRFTFDFLLPGTARQDDIPGLSTYWQSPEVIASSISGWVNTQTQQTFTVTDAGIGMSVYVQTFTYAPSGGYGDFDCQITLVEVRSLTITSATTTTTTTTTGSTTTTTSTGTAFGSGQPDRATPPPPTTYTVQPGDSLWSIAQIQLGDGNQWSAIYNLNVATIGPDASVLQPGMQLVMPGSS